MRAPGFLFALGLVGAIVGDRLRVHPAMLLFALVALGGAIGWLASRRPLTGRFALGCAALAPLGAALGAMFC